MTVSARTRPRSTTPSPASEPVCAVCGRGPARVLSVRRHMGLIFVMKFASAKLPLCRPHGIAVAHEYLRRTLIEGWWGFLSFFLNWFAVVADMRALRQARRLPFPNGPDPATRIDSSSALPEEAIAAVGDTDEEKAKRKSVLKTVAVAIGLGVVVLVAGLVTRGDVAENMPHRLAFDDGLVLWFYAVVALLVSRHLTRGDVRPRLAEGRGQRAVAIGVLTGGGVALALVGLMSLIDGRLSSDPNVLLVFSERSWTNMLVLSLILVVIAPVIEEVLFRGLLVESLRSRGRSSAILGGAVAFAFWHLNPLALRYYVLVGFLLGYLYWRFGLAGSVFAHATFNGVLLVMGIVAVTGGSHPVDKAGVHLDLPAAWSIVEEGVPGDVDLAAESRTGAGVVIVHADAPSAGAAAMKFVPPPGARSPRPFAVAGVNGVRFGLTLRDEHPTDVVVVQRGMRRWVVTLVPEGSEQAVRDFDSMLKSLVLPALP